jgi:SAM-dependent methyltransferase
LRRIGRNRAERNRRPPSARSFSIIFPCVKKRYFRQKLSICDAGCAGGEATALFKKEFPANEVHGFDFSTKAVEKASRQFEGCEFFQADINSFSQEYDVIFTSNVLEHFSQPVEILRHLANQTCQHLIIMVPYQQFFHGDEHEAFFELNSFPFFLGRLSISFAEIIETAGYEEAMWEGKQLLLVYSDKIFLEEQEFNAFDLLGKLYNGAVSEKQYSELAKQYEDLIAANKKHYDELCLTKEMLSQTQRQQMDIADRMQKTSIDEIGKIYESAEEKILTVRREAEARICRIREEAGEHESVLKKRVRGTICAVIRQTAGGKQQRAGKDPKRGGYAARGASSEQSKRNRKNQAGNGREKRSFA